MQKSMAGTSCAWSLVLEAQIMALQGTRLSLTQQRRHAGPRMKGEASRLPYVLQPLQIVSGLNYCGFSNHYHVPCYMDTKAPIGGR